MTDVDPEKATIGDLFRLMTEMRGNMATRDDLSEVRTEMNARFDEASGEREAIRNVVDDDLASHDQMLRVEGDIVEIKKTQRQHGKKIDRLAESMQRADIPVR
ncbi:MAG: hypothetical protein ACR2RF_10855 [Geminicoccaceae bacterium]